MPENLDAVLIVIIFIIPGFISQRVLGSAIARQQRDTQDVLLEAILFSCLNFAVWGWLLLVVPDLSREYVERHRALVISAWIVFLLIAPLVWGMIFAFAISRGWLARFYRFFRLRYRDPTPRAWDHYFGQRRQGWVRATLTDGTLVAGFMGTQSFASSFPASEDLYLETVYRVDEQGILSLSPVANSGGIWIQGSQIKFMEFLSVPEGATGHGESATDAAAEADRDSSNSGVSAGRAADRPHAGEASPGTHGGREASEA